ncbi:DEAD/DEAH box helicase [Vibrio vulnificus]|uniref:DEAD/DEAH box helicase n=1 Tax=Vibrio vulnificus TaxID=672 RepID=UPI001A33C103|nr:DEAD/DEAH box helicase [Vibrio vulnificus]MCA4011881.1 DEAD/DEAH box helicase [Vibrio vulnificus]HAS6041983.1 DEAD/DEAH box helicase [Vibrio vulnificus]HAS8623957.1 DEAD/DEAH box helicase [Vibrio vulnificus]
MDVFDKCAEINDLIINKNELSARNELIKLLAFLEEHEKPYSPLVNNLIRQVGLYPYLKMDTSSWQDRFVYESFKVDVGGKKTLTLHREQSSILKKLINGSHLAVSAPTSFGKSFIIDSFIAIKKPDNIVIIVPTIALTDETRRRLHKKFSNEYKVITTSEVSLSDKNIFVFPQERAIHYVNKLDSIDMLVIDEFYKASADFDKERSPALINAILKLGSKAKQRYFLAPNIKSVNDSIFTKGMEFIPVDFNTVYLEKHDLFNQIGKNEDLKSDVLLEILSKTKGKSLIYAGTYSNITNVSNLLIDKHQPIERLLLREFELWLTENYDRNWKLTNLIKRGSGIHNGQLHRSLTQIQVRLFEEPEGLTNLISTSSIIEGVNTSAENVIIWKNKNGRSKLNDFTYRNIIGRGGRMFKHFIGKIYILDEPPKSGDTQLTLDLPEELAGDVDLEELKNELTPEQIAYIIAYKQEMDEILGYGKFNELQESGQFESSNSILLRDIAKELVTNKQTWSGLNYLNSSNVNEWDRLLYLVLKLAPGQWGIQYGNFVGFIKVLSNNWNRTIPQLLDDLDQYDIGVDKFFELERHVTFKLTSILNDINVIQKNIIDQSVDISSFIAKVSNAFLPPLVYQLEEYGLPRMLSKKIHEQGIIDLERTDIELHDVFKEFTDMSIENRSKLLLIFTSFDRYIFDYFLEGITID